MQPGQTLTPDGDAQPPEDTKPQNSEPNTEGSDEVTHNAEPDQDSSPVEPTPTLPSSSSEQPVPINEPNSWQLSPPPTRPPDQTPAGNNHLVSWSASEYVAHQKGLSWFMGLGFVVAVIAIGIFLITHDLVSPITIALLGLGFGVFATKQPRVLQYGIGPHGITIGEKLYTYDRFKTFSVVDEGPLHSIVLAPLQRFMPPITIYYDHADEDRITDILGDYLPFAEAKRDAVDSLMRRVRF